MANEYFTKDEIFIKTGEEETLDKTLEDGEEQ